MNSSTFSIRKLAAFSVIVLIAIGAAFFAIDRAPDQITEIPPVLNEQGDPVPDGIASLEMITLGGADQWILVRGQSADNPVLLFLHGGPGASIMPWVDLIHTPALEANFTVVHWDQRGAGKSYDAALTMAELHPDRLVADTLELTDMLRDRFGQDKIFLAGHSWGSALGFLTLRRDSSPYHAYIATSERVDWADSFQMGYDWAVQEARQRQDGEILDALEALAPFDPFNEEHLSVQREAIEKYLAGDSAISGRIDEMIDYAVAGKSPYYTAADVDNYIEGLALTSRAVEIPEIIQDYDLRQNLTQIDIPVHFITGTQDMNTPLALVEDYAAMLDAPDVTITPIEGAAHMVMWDDADAWVGAMISIKARVLDQ